MVPSTAAGIEGGAWRSDSRESSGVQSAPTPAGGEELGRGVRGVGEKGGRKWGGVGDGGVVEESRSERGPLG